MSAAGPCPQPIPKSSPGEKRGCEASDRSTGACLHVPVVLRVELRPDVLRLAPYALDLAGSQSLGPGVDAGAAVERNVPVLRERHFARVLRAGETGDRPVRRLVELEAEPIVELLVAPKRIRREVLVAHEHHVAVLGEVARHEPVDGPPEQGSLAYDIVGISAGGLHLRTEWIEAVPHQGLLFEQVAEVERVAQLLQAADHRGWMADRYDRLAAKLGDEPVGREHGERILEQDSLTGTASPCCAGPLLNDPERVA